MLLALKQRGNVVKHMGGREGGGGGGGGGAANDQFRRIDSRNLCRHFLSISKTANNDKKNAQRCHYSINRWQFNELIR